MKHFIDGDQVVIVRNDFVDLQNSPAIFILASGLLGKIIRRWMGRYARN